jgi:hypothetical protein
MATITISAELAGMPSPVGMERREVGKDDPASA